MIMKDAKKSISTFTPVFLYCFISEGAMAERNAPGNDSHPC